MESLASASDAFGPMLQLAAVVCGAGVALFAISLVVWTARDVAARTRERLPRLLAVGLVVVLNVFGLLIYLLLRPQETLAERYERELIEELLAREVSAAAVQRRRVPGAALPGDGG